MSQRQNSIEQILRNWSGERIVIEYDRPTGAHIIVAVHSSKMGIPSGGTRMKAYDDLAAAVWDATRLSEGMSYKFAAANIQRGGGKAVIALPADFDLALRNGLLRRYGRLVKTLNGLYETGPDVGTSAADMDIIDETGAPHVFARTPAKGGAGDSGPATGVGVYHGILSVFEHLDGTASVRGKTVLVQGAGSVGGTLIDLLLEGGASVYFSDVDPAAIEHYAPVDGVSFVDPADVYQFECDLFSPNALGAILNEQTIPQLNCRAVAGGANNQLAEAADGERLHARGILYTPDYAMNVGGAMYVLSCELDGRTPEQATRSVAETVQVSVKHILQTAAEQKVLPEQAARQIAESRL